MSDLVHLEFPPPRSWEQFEELCADLFEVMWSDPGLTRHGRAGQKQHGVDIVAARGAIFPVGLQCKKKARWPVRRLTFAELKAETNEADNFSPPLKEFYVLTTAPGDAVLDEQVRVFNVSRKKQKKFIVHVISWSEIVRRVARHDAVARKHFSISAGGKDFSPLLANWYVKKGALELTGDEWNLAVGELGEDFQDWPTGHVVLRRRETDELASKVQAAKGTSPEARKLRIELRQDLRHALDRERRIEVTIRELFTQPQLRFYMLDLYRETAATILQSIIEYEFDYNTPPSSDSKISIDPPSPERLKGPLSANSVATADIPVWLLPAELASILRQEEAFFKRYKNRMSRVVMELPPEVRDRRIIPAILRRLDRIMQEDEKTWGEMSLAGYLDIGSWKYSV